MWHVWHYFAPFLPEAVQAIEEIGTFVQARCGQEILQRHLTTPLEAV
jgi:hypothetical protein